MVKAIIFDCFGVLAGGGLLPFLRAQFGGKPEKLAEAQDLSREVDAGLMSYDSFIGHIARLAGIPAKEARRRIESNVPDEGLFAFIKDVLKPRYKIGMLTNAGANWLGEIFSKAQLALFDATALSYETGFIKPQQQAYNAIAERLGCSTDECLFIDDQENYCAGARDAGMQAILYRDIDSLTRALTRYKPRS